MPIGAHGQRTAGLMTTLLSPAGCSLPSKPQTSTGPYGPWETVDEHHVWIWTSAKMRGHYSSHAHICLISNVISNDIPGCVGKLLATFSPTGEKDTTTYLCLIVCLTAYTDWQLKYVINNYYIEVAYIRFATATSVRRMPNTVDSYHQELLSR